MKKTLIAAAAIAAMLPANAVLAGSPAPAPVEPVVIDETDPYVAGGSLSGAGLAAVLVAAAAVIAVAASSGTD